MTPKKMKLLSSSLLGFFLACGPNVGTSEGADGEGAGAGAGAEDDGSNQDMSWAIGYFHKAATGTGRGKKNFEMFEIRPDGTASYVVEVCRDEVIEPLELAWERRSDNEIEVFHPDEESFDWMSGHLERVILIRADGGALHEFVGTASVPTVYAPGRLCVPNPVPVEDCEDFGFEVEICED